jgi:hypothetical protein
MEDKMGGPCGKHGKDETCIRNLLDSLKGTGYL